MLILYITRNIYYCVLILLFIIKYNFDVGLYSIGSIYTATAINLYNYNNEGLYL